ncbi:hypothetical protein, partial [Xanthobacter sediminis]
TTMPIPTTAFDRRQNEAESGLLARILTLTPVYRYGIQGELPGGNSISNRTLRYALAISLRSAPNPSAANR